MNYIYIETCGLQEVVDRDCWVCRKQLLAISSVFLHSLRFNHTWVVLCEKAQKCGSKRGRPRRGPAGFQQAQATWRLALNEQRSNCKFSSPTTIFPLPSDSRRLTPTLPLDFQTRTFPPFASVTHASPPGQTEMSIMGSSSPLLLPRLPFYAVHPMFLLTPY